MEITTTGDTITGARNGETVFTVTHDETLFNHIDFTTVNFSEWRRLITRAGLIIGVEVPDWIGIQYGDNNPIELHILRPADHTNTEILWLTDQQGPGADRAPGVLRLLDALTLQTQDPNIRFAIECRSCDVDIGAAVINPQRALVAWQIDPRTQRLQPINNPDERLITPCWRQAGSG